MLDIKYVRQNLQEVKKALAKRGGECDLEKLLKLDEERKEMLSKIEALKAEQNKMTEKSDRAVEIKNELKELEPQLSKIEQGYKEEAIKVPNIPLEDVPEGKDETANKVIKEVGEIPKQEKVLDHERIGKQLDLIDIERAVKVSGNRFYYLKNSAVELEFALVRYVLDLVKAEKFQPIIPPILIRDEMAWGSGHFESVNDDAYHMKNDPLVAVGTSEQSILPYFSGETIQNLPQRFIGFSTCLRREAGSYGKDVKGIIRAHQFDKLEMFSFCAPEDSRKEHELIVSLEEKIVAGLNLPYRLVAVATGDLGLPSAKTIDLEIWMPGQNSYRETHSSSNCTDFQARRLKIRYKNENGSGFCHTLNGTAVAIGRMLVAILENNQSQDEDGNLIVKVPEVLQKYCGFTQIKNTK